MIIKAHRVAKNETSRDRPKSAPYLRLKNSKRTSKCQSIGEFGTFHEIFLKSHNAEKTERETLWDFSTSILLQKMKGGPFGGKKF